MYPFMADWNLTPYSPGLGSPPSGAAGTALGDHMLHGQFCARDDATNTKRPRTTREPIEENSLRISDSLNTNRGTAEENCWTLLDLATRCGEDQGLTAATVSIGVDRVPS